MAPGKLSRFELDALSEVGNIGGNRAANAINELTGRRVNIRVPKADIIGPEAVSQLMGGPEKVVAAFYVPVSGDFDAEFMVMAEKESVLIISDILLGCKEGTSIVIGEEQQSSFKELANVMAGSYFYGLAQFVGVKLVQAIPHFAIDMVGAVTDFVAAQLAAKGGEALLLETELDLDGGPQIFLFLLLTPKSTEKLLKRAKKLLP